MKQRQRTRSDASSGVLGDRTGLSPLLYVRWGSHHTHRAKAVFYDRLLKRVDLSSMIDDAEYEAYTNLRILEVPGL